MAERQTLGSEQTQIIVTAELEVRRERAILPMRVLDCGDLLLKQMLGLDFTASFRRP